MDKNQLALQVREVISEMGTNAVEFVESDDMDLQWYRTQRRICLEKLVLFSGALASLVLQDQREKFKCQTM